MAELKPRAPSNLAFKVVTVVAVGLLIYIGVCGTGFVTQKYGYPGVIIPAGIVVATTSLLMLIVAVVWLFLKAILRKDAP